MPVPHGFVSYGLPSVLNPSLNEFNWNFDLGAVHKLFSQAGVAIIVLDHIYISLSFSFGNLRIMLMIPKLYPIKLF